MWPCKGEKSCDTTGYSEFIENTENSNKDLLLAEYEKIKEVMRDNKALSHCTVLSFKRLEGPVSVALCTPAKELIEVFKKMITKFYD